MAEEFTVVVGGLLFFGVGIRLTAWGLADRILNSFRDAQNEY